MAKYSELERYLRDQPWDEIPMSFADIERVIGAKLPPKAQHHRAWWSNNPSNNVMTKAWLNAGFRSEQVDVEGRKLVFSRTSATRFGTGKSGMAETPMDFSPVQNPQRKHHPLLGALKGTVVLDDEGFDLTQPAMPEWPEVVEAKYGPERGK